MVQALLWVLLGCVGVKTLTNKGVVSSIWSVDDTQFNVVEAVPGPNFPGEPSVPSLPNPVPARKIKYMEHEYTIEEEDLRVPIEAKKEEKKIPTEDLRVPIEAKKEEKKIP